MYTINTLEAYFSTFRANVIGQQVSFGTPFGRKRMLYADWTASGRAYRPIEMELLERVLPFFGNTHTETTVTGMRMSAAYEGAKKIIKEHVHAGDEDVLLFCGSGMTSAVNKLQRILGMRLPERAAEPVTDRARAADLGEEQRPLVLVTHMEHHSNHISWLETNATVEVIPPDENGNVDLEQLRELLERYRARPVKIAAVTACSNVTGIETPYGEIARLMHACGGVCFVDFACSAPYVDIDMHPQRVGDDIRGNGRGADLDAIYFSGHKFLGGPGTPGVLVFNRKLYGNRIPDQPGGGTLLYSNPWGGREYVEDIEAREDGGTPPILQGIKAGLCVRLKEEMGVERMRKREEAMLLVMFDRFSRVKNVEILEEGIKKRLGIISFIITGAHYNLAVKILNDRFGIQTRGGCSCAGTYGHRLLRVDKERSYEILDSILAGDLRCKPGWIRLSIHPTMTDAEIDFIMDAIESTAAHFEEWGKDYKYEPASNEYVFKGLESKERRKVEGWFNSSGWEVSPDR